MANKHLIRGTRMALGLNPEVPSERFTVTDLVWDQLGHSAKVSIILRMLAAENKRATSNTLHTLLNRKWKEIPAVWQDRLYKINWGAPVAGPAKEKS